MKKIKNEPEYDTIDNNDTALVKKANSNYKFEEKNKTKFKSKPSNRVTTVNQPERITRRGKDYNRPNANDLYTENKAPPVSMLKRSTRSFIDENDVQYWLADQFIEFQLIVEDILTQTIQTTKTSQVYFVRASPKHDLILPGKFGTKNFNGMDLIRINCFDGID